MRHFLCTLCKVLGGLQAEVYISIFVGAAAPTIFCCCHAEIFKSGYFMQIYSNQSVLCRNIGQVPLRVTKSCEAVYLDQTKPKTVYMDTMFILFLVPLFTKNGAKLTCCMIGGKLLISPCRKNAFFGFCAEI